MYVASDGGRVSTPTHIIAMILLSLKQIAKMNVKTRFLIVVLEYLFVSQVFKEETF